MSVSPQYYHSKKTAEDTWTGSQRDDARVIKALREGGHALRGIASELWAIGTDLTRVERSMAYDLEFILEMAKQYRNYVHSGGQETIEGDRALTLREWWQRERAIRIQRWHLMEYYRVKSQKHT